MIVILIMIFIHCLLKTNSCNKIFTTHIDSCNPRHDYPLRRRTQATSASYTAEQVHRETQLQQREERGNIPPEEENDEMLDAHGNGRTTAKLDKANIRHDYPFKRRKDNNNSILSSINQPDAFNGMSALRLRTLRSSQKQVPRETQLQQGEERETNIPVEEENHDMLDAQGNDSRTTDKNVCVLEFLAAFYLALFYFFHIRDGSSLLAVYVQFMLSFSTPNDKRIRHLFSDFFFPAKLDRANAKHDYPFKRRKDSDNSILSTINQLDAFNGTSALRLRTLRSSQKQVPRETQLQQGEERETNIPAEEENHDMLDAQGNDSRTTEIAEDFIMNTTKKHGCNKLKPPKEPIYISVNNFGQPDNSEARKLSSFVGVLARDPRIMPIDCIDFRKIGEDRVEHIWNIVQGSKGKETRQWFRETLAASWRWNKCKLKREKFNGKSVNEALKSRPTIIPEDQWRNAVQFWASTLGQARTERNLENRALEVRASQGYVEKW
ncbi:hypothetical protein Cgig2_005303 [Carnegiea gigantea]|uniref:Uncharacterized protein n=1 Tax=Carnegiea gigantea TaxID=171969 RepID=A0A9Q1K161_9CARY|nr:hypothetical protein Cgig2_005303 [Carnegiea gigantea]